MRWPYRTSPLGSVVTDSADTEEEMDLAKITSTAAQNIPNGGVDTAVLLGTQAFQKGTTVTADPANNRITVAAAGYYGVTIEMDIGATATGSFKCKLFLNGTEEGTELEFAGDASVQHTLSRTTVSQYPAGGVLTLKASQTTATANIATTFTLAVVKLAST